MYGEGIHIQHARNGGEVRLAGKSGRLYNVDGYCEATDTIYEFHGTMWHSDPAFYDPSDFHPIKRKRGRKVTNDEVLLETWKREDDLRAAHKLIVLWESTWSDIKKLYLPAEEKARLKKVMQAYTAAAAAAVAAQSAIAIDNDATMYEVDVDESAESLRESMHLDFVNFSY